MRALLGAKAFHRWDALLHDLVVLLARRDGVAPPTSLQEFKRIFDMEPEVALETIQLCVPRLGPVRAQRWCDLLWVDRVDMSRG